MAKVGLAKSAMPCSSCSSGHSRWSRSASLEREPSDGQTSSSRTSRQCFAELDRSVRREGTKVSPGPRCRAPATRARVGRGRRSTLSVAGSCSDTGSHSSTNTRDTVTQVQLLQQMVNKLQEEKDALVEELHGPVERPRVRQRVSCSRGCTAHADVDSSRFKQLDFGSQICRRR